MDMYIHNFNFNSGYVPDKIKIIGIIASYDICWNQRATGRLYDSLSGHEYLIGCRSGCVIAYELKAKNV